MAAPTNAVYVKKALANSEPSVDVIARMSVLRGEAAPA